MSAGVEADLRAVSVDALRSVFPLHGACRDGDVSAVTALLQQSSDRPLHLTAEDSLYGWTPIHWAAHFGKLECVVRLVQVGCEVNAVTSRFAQTPAHIAAFGGHPDCLLWLLRAGADLNRQDYVGETPIHKAARAGSLECINALLISGAKPDLRNANGLTAADLAHAQGFQECAQLLINAENQLKQISGFSQNGIDHAHIQGRSLLNGVANRKRLLDCSEANHSKKARTDSLDFPVKTLSGAGEEMECMYVESAADNQSDGTIETATGLRNGCARQKNFAGNGHCHPAPTETRSDMCGSLHLSGSPSSYVSHRPSWSSLTCDSSEHLHYGYYHGFGDTAEDLEDANGSHDHNTSITVDQYYDQDVLSAMQLYHGS
ncbi:ankyrin repeat domain-containing protein 10a [Hoplias malabaricus]|uniref:ankyrin repeat domain-containing protein 10a n=1 Tax=Hoplias malabaricus TaxID=27720 RepID=UPI0034636C56